MKIICGFSIAVALVTFSLALPSVAGAEQAKLKIAVLDLGDKGVGAQVVSLLPAVISKQLSTYGLFEVLSREDIQKMLSHEQDKMLMGCTDESCLAEIGGALGAEVLISGDVGKVGEKVLINLQRINIRNAKVDKRATRQFEGSPSQLLDEVRLAAHEVVADLLAKASGQVVVTVSEEGSDVSVDGSVVGTSPLRRLELPAGPHDVRVIKQGFVAWARTIRVQPNATEVVEVTLIPSANFIQTYEDQAQSMRRWAWISAAAFLVMEGAALGMRVYTWQEIDPLEDDYNGGNYGDLTQDAYYSKYKDDIDRGETLDYAALGLGIGGLVMGAISMYLFIEGENPDRYERFRGEVEAPVSAFVPNQGGFSSLPGGGAVTLGWGF